MRNELFNKMNNLSNEDKTYFLSRLFGLMESYETDKKTLTSETFFNMLEARTNKNKEAM